MGRWVIHVRIGWRHFPLSWNLPCNGVWGFGAHRRLLHKLSATVISEQKFIKQQYFIAFPNEVACHLYIYSNHQCDRMIWWCVPTFRRWIPINFDNYIVTLLEVKFDAKFANIRWPFASCVWTANFPKQSARSQKYFTKLQWSHLSNQYWTKLFN